MIDKAAIKRGERVWTGRRHGEIILAMLEEGEAPPVPQREQGFVTETGEWLNRQEAFEHAVKCGQLPVGIQGSRMLISEMVW